MKEDNKAALLDIGMLQKVQNQAYSDPCRLKITTIILSNYEFTRRPFDELMKKDSKGSIQGNSIPYFLYGLLLLYLMTKEGGGFRRERKSIAPRTQKRLREPIMCPGCAHP